MPFCLVKSIKELKIVSLFGVFTVFATIVVCSVISIIDWNSTADKGYTPLNIKEIPQTLSTLCFAFGGSVVFPTVEGNMKNPKKWNKILPMSLICLGVFYFMISSLGYFAYGKSVQSPIYNSLESYIIPKNIVVLMITIHILLSCPIFLCTFALDLEDYLNITVEKYGKKSSFSQIN